MTTRILILGGSRFQVPLIRRARERGLHVITCDYLPDNPGHKLADEYHNVSTTDREAVLALARRIGIDAVASMSSDPAMPALAYVANSLGLPGPRLEAIVRLTDKGAFRRLMAEAGLPVPWHRVVDAASAAASEIAAALPMEVARLVVKPVDSSGSRGVTVIDRLGGDLAGALRHAFEHSLARRAIVEEYIEGEQIHGDGYLQDGHLVYHYMGDHALFTGSGGSIPVSTRWPTSQGEAVLREVAAQVEAVVRASGFVDGPINIEARITPAGEVRLIEIGPRNAGGQIPILLERLTGFDFVRRVLDSALGIRSDVEPANMRRGVGAVYVLHSERDGLYAGIEVSDAIRDRIFLLETFSKAGDPVRRYAGSNTSLGVALLQFESLAESDCLMAGIASHLVPRIH
ncbi:MAG: ATP-grasp domain-containing protein [Burkholderiales bacterium]|nr:MAG: ATP-grasp domain-containing protein [Burkholderiales bacterium]